MKFGELIEHTIECIRTFNPVYKTIDSHADEFLANVNNPSGITFLFSLKTHMKKYLSSKFFTGAYVTRNSLKYFAKFSSLFILPQQTVTTHLFTAFLHILVSLGSMSYKLEIIENLSRHKSLPK